MLMRTFLTALLAIAIAKPTWGAQKQAAAARPVEALAWLVGGVWTAQPAKAGSGIDRAEMRYAWSDNGDYIRFNMHFLVHNKVQRIYDGSFFWNPQTATLEMWNMNGKNEILQGPVKVEGNTVSMTFPAKSSEEKEVDFRMVMTREAANRYSWSMEEKEQNGWKQLMGLEYTRARNARG